MPHNTQAQKKGTQIVTATNFSDRSIRAFLFFCGAARRGIPLPPQTTPTSPLVCMTRGVGAGTTKCPEGGRRVSPDF